MEEMLLACAQFLIEIFIPLFVELFINFIAYFWWPKGNRFDNYIGLSGVGTLLGLASGFCPSPFGNNLIVQAIVIVAGPWALAFSAQILLKKMDLTNNPRLAFWTFWRVFWFTFSFLLCRSFVIHHKSLGLGR